MPALRLVLAQAVRAERLRAGLSQDELASQLGWARSTVTKVELGHRHIAAHELPALCRALAVTLQQLLRDADPADRDAIGL